MPSVSRSLIPGTISQNSGGVNWTNLNNAKVEDGLTADSGLIGPGGGGGSANQVQGTNLGFNLPSSAVIDGIVLRAKVTSGAGSNDSDRIFLLYNGGSTNPANTPNIGQNWFGGLKWLTYGNPTSLWGKSWTPADINHTSFGASLSTQINTGTSNAAIDAILVTVYYHLGGDVAATDVPTREVHKVYNSQGQYIGILPQPTEPLKFAQDINSLGSQISLSVPVSGDTSPLGTENYTTEDGSADYTTEDGSQPYTTEGIPPIFSAAFQGIDSLVKNGNTVECWVYNYFYPNGKCMYVGKIRRWEGDFGGDGSGSDTVTVILYSTGYDLDNYVTRGAPFSYTDDQVQNVANAYDTVYVSPDKGGFWHKFGQTFTTGAAVTNLGAITIRMNGSAEVTINVYDAPNGNLIGTTTQSVSVVGDTDVQFGFPNLIPVNPNTQYFFEVLPGPGASFYIIYASTNPYSGGTQYVSDFGGGGGGGWSVSSGNDLYFKTASGTPSTAATFTAKDPSTGMLAPIITDYNLRGGAIQWKAQTIDATGLSLTYRFNVQTIYDALQAILSLAPDGFYYYVDLGAQTIYFKDQSTTADFLFIKGVHINTLKLITTTENSKNQILFTGGDAGGGVNLFKQYADNRSIAAFGPLLDRKTDGRVTLDPTADAIGLSAIAEFSGEQYQTTVTILHTTRLDITQLVPGKVVGFRGFGTFVDGVLAQIVRRDWTAEGVNLTLGVLPTRLNFEYQRTTRQLLAEQTADNPSAPS